MTDLRHLFQPIRLGRVDIRNRIVLTGHGTGMGRDFKPDERMIAYYAQRARGEVGLIMLGSQQVHPSSPGLTGLLCNYDDSIIPGLRDVARAVHRHSGQVFGYLSHMGLASSARPTALWSASNAYEQKYGEVAHAMTTAEIEEITAAHAAAALRCLEAGLDGLQVHCGHGLLLQQFLSPLTNHRTDAYGGSVENRVRFPAAVLRAVRRAVGPDVTLGIRCSGDELIEGGLTAVDMAEIVPMLVEAGALDYVDVSAGSDGDLVSNMRHEPPMGLPFAPFANVSRMIREKIDVPVIHGTRIHTAEEAEALIARGDADMAGMARALIADPALPVKARTGRGAEIVPCIACEQACLGRLHRGRHISCVGNPATGREAAYGDVRRTAEPRRITVVGGGPAGMEAALQARVSGHEVVLIERAPALGGRLRLAARPAGREEWLRLIEHKIAALARAGVDCRCGVEADGAMLRALASDIVVLATGARHTLPALPGVETAPILSVDEVVANPSQTSGRVLVVDYLDRQQAMVAAIMLGQLGRDVTLATPSLQAGLKLELQNVTEFYRRAYSAGVAFSTLSQPTGFDGGLVQLRNPIGAQTWQAGPFDHIIMVTPGAPDDGLKVALDGAGITVHAIGDAYAPRDVEAAILEGFELGRSF